jgi:uncharacterized membrane protein
MKIQSLEQLAVLLDQVFWLQAIVTLLVTGAYLFMLMYALINLTTPPYENAFDTLLKWSVVPGVVWGSLFTTAAAKITLSVARQMVRSE